MVDARRVARLLWGVVRRDDPRRALAAVVLDVVGIAGGVALIALWLKLIVDGAAAGDRRAVLVAGLGLAVSLSLSGAITAWTATLFQDLHESGGLVLMQDVMRHAAGVPGIEHHERPEYADRIALVRSQGRMLTGFVGTAGRAVSFLARLTVTILLLASVHPALLALPLLAVPSAWTGARARRLVEAAREATAEQARLAEHLFGVVTRAPAAKEVRVYRLEDEIARRQSLAWETAAAGMARANLRAGLLRAAGWLPFLAGFAGAILLAAALAGRGSATAGDVLLVVALATDVGAQVGRAVALANDSAGIYRGTRRLLWLADYAAAARAPVGEPAPVPERLAGGITFEGVGFRYPGTDADVLAGIDLHLPAGAVVAVVGENGAGKTTLVKLLTRCYEPTSGRVLVDGTDLRRIDVDQWRQRLSAGFQDYARLGFLLREAVGAGHLPKIDDLGQVEAALGRAQAADLGPTLPLGIETQLGKEFAGGADLSEGQWQKVAIARALMFDEPLLLVLDEPTSGLDPDAEHALFERYAEAAALAGARRGAVTVLISHRFSTVRLADLIVVMAGGRVVELGTHAQLMAGGGLYADLYSVQARALAGEERARKPEATGPGRRAGA